MPYILLASAELTALEFALAVLIRIELGHRYSAADPKTRATLFGLIELQTQFRFGYGLPGAVGFVLAGLAGVKRQRGALAASGAAVAACLLTFWPRWK